MGANYYLKKEAEPTCKCCNRPYEDEILHIGKCSGGWCFSLHVIPELGLNSLDDWTTKIVEDGWSIENEYGNEVSPSEMLFRITERARVKPLDWSEVDLARNYAVEGPNNLVRHKLGYGCVGHGEGTWDYIEGEFS